MQKKNNFLSTIPFSAASPDCKSGVVHISRDAVHHRYRLPKPAGKFVNSKLILDW